MVKYLLTKRAVEDLNPQPEYILVDGNLDPGLNFKTKCIIKGDSISISIAAASVIAKVTRDNLMLKLDKEFPNYNWKKNKGYGTIHDDVQSFYDKLVSDGICPFVDLYTIWYWRPDCMANHKEFAILDPDGYMLRFSECIGNRPNKTDD